MAYMKPSIKWKIFGGKYTANELGEMLNIAPALVRHRLKICKKLGMPLEEIDNAEFWDSRNPAKSKIYVKDENGKQYSLTDISEMIGKDVSTIRFRHKKCLEMGWPFSRIFDNSLWQRARNPSKKKKMKKKKEKDILDRIPSPSPVELRMEKMGLL